MLEGEVAGLYIAINIGSNIIKAPTSGPRRSRPRGESERAGVLLRRRFRGERLSERERERETDRERLMGDGERVWRCIPSSGDFIVLSVYRILKARS